MRKFSAVLILVAALVQSVAQIPIGSFREWLPKHTFFSVTQGNDYVYAASDGGVLYVEKSSGAVNFWSKVNSLSESEVTGCYCSKADGVLAVTYANANMDFIKGDKIVNVSDIKNKPIVGSKNINSIFYRDGLAYLSCDFGVVVIGLSDFLIKETLFTDGQNGYAVNDMIEFDGHFYIFTSSGIYSIESGSGSIANINDWQRLPQFGTEGWRMARPFGGGFVAVKAAAPSDSLFMFRNGVLTPLPDLSSPDFRYFDVKDDRFLLCNREEVIMYNADFEKLYSAKSWWVFGYEDAKQAIIGDGNVMWIADAANGLLKIDSAGNKNEFHIDGPCSNLSFKMDCHDNSLAIVPGSCAGYNAPHYVESTLSCFSDDKWTRYYRIYYPELFSINASDFCCVAINPRNKSEVYVGSWKDGVFKFAAGQQPVRFTPDNSALQYSSIHAGYADFTLVSDLCFDGNNNLWIANSFCNYPLSVLKSDGSWRHFNIGAGVSSAVGRVCVDSRGYKWITIRNSDKTWRLVAFNDNKTIDNTSDDKVVTANLNDYCNVSTTTVSCVAEDMEGKIWIGTEQGVKVIYNAANAFSSTPYAQNILIDANGNMQNLLEFEAITDIEVDDANRKWIATEKAGVFLVSASGTEELLHFNADNSPLLSDKVNDIVINRENGEVFFATAAGIVSYRGTATVGKENFDEVKVFPNPVKEGYNGIIAVTGLMQNSFCKIADASGHLVWQGYADGGQLNWNGKDLYGNRPATGVYFVFASDETGKVKKVAKLLFVK